MLEVALISAHAAHLTTHADLDYALRAVTAAPAQAMRSSDYGLREGGRADLQLFPVSSWSEALRTQPLPEKVWFRGRLVAANSVRSQIYRALPAD
jgi:cytosine/creatinine deaminase